ncbi:hypothetical protein GGD66_008384 [Bradyrhizobium sp. CIR48]|nr:hypothetical protein [Bradyrhizobium sp. CIR48]
MSKLKKREKGIWQRRYWEHTIRDDADLERHVDYIHFNPVKHELVTRVRDWSLSSFHRYVEQGDPPRGLGRGHARHRGSFRRVIVGTAREEHAFHPTAARQSIVCANHRRVGKAKRAHVFA